ncbi:leptin-like [Anarrhichthys ocellatus]|uniref:leptin-like n=1 Tax=Anarrhichthys ocellatus TaxID=433405 RepID=UPI0012ED612E|nr:leptin-like [Anarrhichthys ocellatus]
MEVYFLQNASKIEVNQNAEVKMITVAPRRPNPSSISDSKGGLYTIPTYSKRLHLDAQSVCSAAPLPVEVVTMKLKVKWMAEQLVVRLNKDFQAPAGLTLSPPADDLEGPSSVVVALEGYNSLICDTLNGVAQVKFDISSLTGYLDQWRQGHCSEQRPKPSVPGPLQRLQSRKEFIHTVSIEALMRVKEYLSLLLNNLDHLETC